MKKILLATLLFAMTSYAQTYEGTSFNEILQVLNDQKPILNSPNAVEDFKAYQGRLPHYPVNSVSVFGVEGALVKDAKRTINDKFDYYDYLPKRLHPNGVCVVGEWHATEPSNYTGYFKQGSKGLFIGRVSVAMGEVLRGEKRGFGFAGKIFPTLDENEKVKPANFFTVDVLLGTKIERFLDTKTTNQPETGFSLSLLGLGLKIASALKQADEDPSFRPVTPIAKLSEGSNNKSPRWMRISTSSNTIKNNQADFRNEILQAVSDNGEVAFNVDVSDATSDRSRSEWQRIGEIRIKSAIVSFGCDRQLHFAHPRLND